MYPQRDKDGKITGLFRWPNELADKEPLAEDSPEVQEFRGRKMKAPTSVDALVKALVRKGVITAQDIEQ